MFKFLKDIKKINNDINHLKAEVYKNLEDNYWGVSLEARVTSIDEKLDAIMKHFDLVVDRTPYQPEVKTKLIVRKKTKKDDESKGKRSSLSMLLDSLS